MVQMIPMVDSFQVGRLERDENYFTTNFFVPTDLSSSEIST